MIDIDLADIKEPILCAPNDPDDARPLSAVQGEKIDEVFIGSCMTNIGHFRAAGKLLDAHKGQVADPPVGGTANAYGRCAADRRRLLQRLR